MRKWSFFAFVAILLMACGTTTINISTPVPTVNPNPSAGSDDAASPREAVNDSGLPPTFTPAPTQPPPTPYTPRAGDAGGGSGEVPLSGDTYRVQRGDTLGEIATRFGVSVSDLAQANGISNIDVIEVGQVLVIPEN